MGQLHMVAVVRIPQMINNEMMIGNGKTEATDGQGPCGGRVFVDRGQIVPVPDLVSQDLEQGRIGTRIAISRHHHGNISTVVVGSTGSLGQPQEGRIQLAGAFSRSLH